MNKKISVIAIAGAPNAGKSTLINQLVGQKIAIVTSKCQTTRSNTKGIINVKETQLVFIDTPGIFNPAKLLEHNIVKQARVGLEEADRICLTVDAAYAFKQDFTVVLQNLRRVAKPVVLLLNKVDLIKDKRELLHLTEAMGQKYAFETVFMISAKKNLGLQVLIDHFYQKANPGHWIFEEEIASNITDRTLAEEITRENLYYALGAELPYSVEVKTELWEEKENNGIKIHQVIHVLKDSQKKILLGAGGSKLKSIGQKSRMQLSTLLEKPVHLFLYVKVKPDWIESSVRS